MRPPDELPEDRHVLIRRSVWLGVIIACLFAETLELCSQRLSSALLFAVLLVFFLDVVDNPN